MRDLYRKRGSEVWYGQFKTADGVRHQVCLHTKDRAEALARLRVHARTEAPKDSPAYSLNDALAYLVSHGCTDNAEATVRMYRQRSDQIVRVLPQLDVNSATRDDWQRFIDKRLEEGASRSTVHKELVAIRRALELARDRGLYTGHLDVLPRFRTKYEPRRRWLDYEAYKRLLRVLPASRRLWLVVAVYTGARLSEVEGLMWSDVDLGRKWLHIKGSKTKKSDRYLPIPEPLLEALSKVKAKKRHGPVVGRWPNVRRSMRRHAKISPNDLRRTYASWLKQKNTDSMLVAQLLGHTSTRMVEAVYGHLADANLVAAVATLPGNARVTKRKGPKRKGEAPEKPRPSL